MRLSALSILIGTFVGAALLSVLTAFVAATVIERSSADAVKIALELEEIGWADVSSNGLQVQLTGTAETEAERFRAITIAAHIVDAARVIDKMDVADSAGLAPPRFSIELLRNDGQLSLIGLIPAETDRDALIVRLSDLPNVTQVADLLETAEYPAPETWAGTIDYAATALRDLPRSKISLAAGKVIITAMVESDQRKKELETRLNRRAAGAITLTLDISAPRPVISPFTLRYIVDDDGGRFDACSADTEASRNRITQAAQSVNLKGEARCTLGLGVPSPEWGAAASSSILAIGRIGKGSVTMSDADITFTAAEDVDRATFDRVVGELDNALPGVFALHPVFPETQSAADQGPAEFSATLSPEGQLQMRGRIGSELSRKTASSYAKSRFGSDKVYMAARLDETLPEAWSLRVLAGLQALTELANGAVSVTETSVTLTGVTGNKDAKSDVARILSDQLGSGQQFDIKVTYNEKLDPDAARPAPEKCIADLTALQGKKKIGFEPGSATVTGDSRTILDQMAEVLRFCGPLKIEIGGHTDSQGREEMNLDLSQDRAETVMTELSNRRVDTQGYVATGFGETQPIGDNKTEAGREENRRIEFKLIADPDDAAPSGDDETTDAPAQDQGQDQDDAKKDQDG